MVFRSLSILSLVVASILLFALTSAGDALARSASEPKGPGLATITGHARIPNISSQPTRSYIELYEWNIWLGANGDSENQFRRTGAPPGQPPRGDGFYSFSVPAGDYSFIMHQPEFFVRPRVVGNLSLQGGEIVTMDAIPPHDYAVAFGENSGIWGVSPWDWGEVFHQTFVATGTSITKVEFKLAGTNTNTIRVSIHEDNGNSDPANWPQVGTERIHPNVGVGGDNWVAWLSNEVPTTPGDRYAVRFTDATGSDTIGFYVHRDSVGPGYDNGTAWRAGAAQSYDLYSIIGSDNDGTLIAYGKRAQRKPAELTEWAGRWGQTWKAKGRGLAGMELFAAGGGDWDIRGRVRVFENGPGGQQIGPEKISNTAFWGPGVGIFGVSYSPGEVQLTPGNTYYIEVSAESPSLGFNPLQFVLPEDNYTDGTALRDGAQVSGLDLEMTIVEWREGGALPTATPTPPPVQGDNLLRNGDLEDGQAGQGDSFSPDFWDNWESRPETTHWYGEPFGQGGTRGARVIGGSINGTQIQGGIVQRVDELSPALEYRISGWANASQVTGDEYATYIGYDLTGQTADPLSGSVQWFPLATQSGAWQQFVSDPVSPVIDSISVWTRGENFTAADTYFADFDDLSLVALIDATPTPTLSPSPTVTPSPTPGGANETSFILFDMARNWYGESDFRPEIDRDNSGQIDEADLFDLVDAILSGN